MKRVVMSGDYRESDLKPHDLFDNFLAISAAEVKRLLIDKGSLIETKCPACDSGRKRFAFQKFGLDYQECLACSTLYISARPSEERISEYFLESKANEFWNEHVLKETVKARVRHLIRPEAMWVANTTGELAARAEVFGDIKSRNIEFLEEIDRLGLFKSKMIIHPEIAVPEALDSQRGFRVVKEPIGSIDADGVKASVLTGFYVIDRCFHPPSLLATVKSMLADKGLLFLVSSTISGLDLQVLWENSRTIFPPENMNILSIEGFEILLERSGFEIIELSTPGQLDVEYIKTAMERDIKLEVPRCISYIITKRNADAHQSLQEFLQRFRLSSHVRIVARKR